MARLDEILELYAAYRKAQDAHLAAYKDLPERVDLYNEDHLRAKIKSDRACHETVRTGNAYRDACDEFFKKTAPDLIQLLVDIDEHFDGQVDINNNGGPNMAMRCVQMIEELIGQRPPVVTPPMPVLNHTREESLGGVPFRP